MDSDKKVAVLASGDGFARQHVWRATNVLYRDLTQLAYTA